MAETYIRKGPIAVTAIEITCDTQVMDGSLVQANQNKPTGRKRPPRIMSVSLSNEASSELLP